MVTNAWIEKEEKETEMKLDWLNANGYDEVFKQFLTKCPEKTLA